MGVGIRHQPVGAKIDYCALNASDERHQTDRGNVGHMLEIERVGWLKGRYEVHLDQGQSGLWERRRFTEAMTGEVDGEPYHVKRGRWTISAGHSSYELGRRSAWRSEMELRSGGVAVGSIRRARATRGKVQCELPSELSPPDQVFIGLLVLTLWARAAASSGAATVSVTA